ncbi:MAG TPA: hypothetical protein VMW51_09760 [Terriglobia bacterium]|nr:hypothetical protein [Terriglobia bacterium]
MASLNRMEGDVVEFAVLAALVLVVIAVWEAWHNGGSIMAAVAQLLRNVWGVTDSAFNAAVTRLSQPVSVGSLSLTPSLASATGSPYDVVTGSNVGNWSPNIPADASIASLTGANLGGAL